jgi:hypothetical protein
MEIRAPDGEAQAEWRYGELATYSAPDGMLRVGPATGPARIEIRDGDLAAAFTERAGRIRQLGAVGPRTRRKVVGWSLAGVASALLVAMLGLPAMIERMAPLVPLGFEQWLGGSVESRNARSSRAANTTVRPGTGRRPPRSISSCASSGRCHPAAGARRRGAPVGRTTPNAAGQARRGVR